MHRVLVPLQKSSDTFWRNQRAHHTLHRRDSPNLVGITASIESVVRPPRTLLTSVFLAWTGALTTPRSSGSRPKNPKPHRKDTRRRFTPRRRGFSHYDEEVMAERLNDRVPTCDRIEIPFAPESQSIRKGLRLSSISALALQYEIGFQ